MNFILKFIFRTIFCWKSHPNWANGSRDITAFVLLRTTILVSSNRFYPIQNDNFFIFLSETTLPEVIFHCDMYVKTTISFVFLIFDLPLDPSSEFPLTLCGSIWLWSFARILAQSSYSSYRMASRCWCMLHNGCHYLGCFQ